jgi:glycosyltransferase involved in cell wall biosynthesis
VRKVFYFVPSLAIGGVEVGIEKALPALRRSLDIQIFCVKTRGVRALGHNPWWAALKDLVVAPPDVVITSLWPAHPLGLLFKLRGVRWVCFIHSVGFVHAMDRWSVTASMNLADEVAVDSAEVGVFVRSIKKSAKVHVIPYIFPFPAHLAGIRKTRNSFIFVGRSNAQKRLDLVVTFFEHVLTKIPEAVCRFVIAGDIPPNVNRVAEASAGRVEVEANITNGQVLERLSRSEYFVVLSDYEGFCMAAYEAVQAGCFVIYRDVGEIKNYVSRDRSFLVRDPDTFHEQFDRVLEERNRGTGFSAQGNIPAAPDHGESYTANFLALMQESSAHTHG